MIQDEIREGLIDILLKEYQGIHRPFDTVYDKHVWFANQILTYLDSQGVVIKKEGVLPTWVEDATQEDVINAGYTLYEPLIKDI